MNYLPFLRAVHDLLRPATYLEVGVRDGNSMSQARCRCVGIDPDFEITKELNCSGVRLFRTTSDEFFARPDHAAETGGEPFDLAFIDGLHIFEFALRDFINVERLCSGASVIIIDDVLPRDVDEAARVRHTVAWTGDVYPIIEVFAKYRPELTVIPVGTTPTGMLIVLGLDPDNTVLADNYDAIMAEFRRPDPQPVPPALLDRLTAVDPTRALGSPIWEVLASASRDEAPAAIRDRVARPLRESLGEAFVGT